MKDCEDFEDTWNSKKLLPEDRKILNTLFSEKKAEIMEWQKILAKLCKQAMNTDGTLDKDKILSLIEQYFDNQNTLALEKALEKVRNRADCDYLEKKVRLVSRMGLTERNLLLNMIRERKADFPEDESVSDVVDWVRSDMHSEFIDDFDKKYAHINITLEEYPLYNYLYEELVDIKKKYEEKGIKTNLFGIDETSLRGRNIVTLPEEFFDIAKAKGLKCIIDLRSEAGDNIGIKQDKIKVEDGKTYIDDVEYFLFPVDHNEGKCDEQTIRLLGEFFRRMESGNLYIGCANGLHRTDFALALNFVLNTKTKNPPELKDSMIKDLKPSVKRIYDKIQELIRTKTPEELEQMGLDKETLEKLPKDEKEFLARLNALPII